MGTRANKPGRAPTTTDHGFTLIEQVISMAVIVGALLGLLSTLGTTARAMTTGRQRTIAVSLAKQVIENLQGADWTSVATGTGVTTADPNITAGTPLKFGGEDLYFGGNASYRTTQVAVGTTFTLRTFVTTVPPAAGRGTGYRHVTVIIEWPSSSSTPHSLQFSSLVFPLDYTSFPSSNGSAEVTDGLITLGGCLGGDTFDDVHVALPGARSDTIASTLRTAIGAATSAAAHVETHTRIDSTTCVPVAPVAADNCPGANIASIADNDSSTTTSNAASGSGGYFACSNLATAGGLVVSVPPAAAATLAATAKTDLCSPACPFAAGVADAVPWADARVTPTAGSSAAFNSGELSGKLWSFANDWSATSSVDHDAVGGVRAEASLSAPALSILSLPGILEGAVKVGSFTATASAASGYTTTSPTLTFGTTVQMWTESGYAPAVTVAAGTNWTGTSTFLVGARQVSLVVTVQTQPLLVVSVAVTITPSTLGPPPGIGTDTFTIEVNYGRVAAHTTWLTKAA